MKKLIKQFSVSSLVTVCGSVLFMQVAFADIAVVANSASSASSLSAKQVKKLFLGKNDSMKPVDQAEGSGIRNDFYSKVAKKNESKMKAYWSKMIFSGKAVPPEIADDDAAVKAWLAKNKNGIGYIDSGSVDGSVKVLYTAN